MARFVIFPVLETVMLSLSPLSRYCPADAVIGQRAVDDVIDIVEVDVLMVSPAVSLYRDALVDDPLAIAFRDRQAIVPVILDYMLRHSSVSRC
jgi:hypothetical protein